MTELRTGTEHIDGRIKRLEDLVYGEQAQIIDQATHNPTETLEALLEKHKEPHKALFVFQSIVKAMLKQVQSNNSDLHNAYVNAETSLDKFRENYESVIAANGSYYLLKHLHRTLHKERKKGYNTIELVIAGNSEELTHFRNKLAILGYAVSIVSEWSTSSLVQPASLVDTNIKFYDLQTELAKQNSLNESTGDKVNVLQSKVSSLAELLQDVSRELGELTVELRTPTTP